MKKLTLTLQKVSDGLFIVEKWLLLAAVTVMIGVNFVNVCMRYVARNSLSICESLSIVLFMFMILVGGNIAVKSDHEIKIEIFKFRSPRKNAAFRLAGDLVSVTAIVLVLAGAVAMFQSTLAIPELITPLPIFTYHEFLIMIVGLSLILLDHVILLCRHVLILMGQPLPDTEGGTEE